jgi:hypothetical protein
LNPLYRLFESKRRGFPRIETIGISHTFGHMTESQPITDRRSHSDQSQASIYVSKPTGFPKIETTGISENFGHVTDTNGIPTGSKFRQLVPIQSQPITDHLRQHGVHRIR